MKTNFFRHTFQLLTLLLVSSTLLNAQQLKLGTNPSVIQKSALLELESNSQGVLLPRITDTTQATIKTAPDGMIIFLTLNNSLCIRAGGQWHKLIPEGEALTSMNGSTVPVQTITATSNAAPASLTTVGGNHFLNLPDASASYSGFVGTGVQTFAGAKTFNNNLTAYQDLLLPNIVVDNTKDSVLLIDAGKVWKKRLTGLPPTGAASGDLSGTYPAPVIAAGAVTGAKMAQAGATTGQVLKWDGTTWAPAADNNTGTLTSVGLTAPSLFTVTNSPLTANGAIALGLQTQTANTVFAGPGTGAAATPTFRTLVAGDIPALPFSNITGVVPIAQGGTNLTAVGANNTFLTSNGTSMAYRTLAVADIPSLPFSKITTGVVPISQGGTGLSAPGTAGYLLVSTGTGLVYMDPVLGGDVINNAFANSIAPKAVSYAKIQDVTTQKILGRYAATNGSTQEISLDNSLKLTTAGTLYADSSLAIWNASKLLGRTLSPLAPASGQVLKYNGTTWAPAADDNTGSLSSVGLTAPAIFTVTNSPLTANGAIALGLQTQTANTIFAGPGTGAAATPAFRALVAGDIPALPFSNITGVVPIAQGGTALNAVGANGTFLTSNGTSIAYRTLTAADIPNLPFTKITGTVPVAQGGTGLTAVGAAGTILSSDGTALSYVTPSVTLAGDVTGASGTNTINAGAVTYAKIQNVTTQKILGRYTAGAGSVQEVSLDNSLKLNTAGTLYADSSLAIWNASKLLGRTLSPLAPASGQVLKYNGTTWEAAADDNTVGLSSVGLTMPSIFNVANSPLAANGTIATTLQNQTANTIFAGPGTGVAATPTFRTLVAGDIPALPFSNITGVVPIAQGGTALSAVGANGTFLTSNGTAIAYRTLAAADIPTLPFTKISGVVPIAQGGTGLTAVGAAGTVLTSNGTSLTYAAPAAGLTSVGLTMPSIFAVTGSPLTANGTIAATLQTQTANTFFAGPGTGAAATPAFRSMVTADIPDQGVTYAKIQNVITQKLLGRYTAGTGSVQEVTLDNSLKLNTAGTLYADSSLAIWNASRIQGLSVSPKAPVSGEVLKWNGTTWESNTDNDGGATYGTVGVANYIDSADVAGSTTRMKIWNSATTGTVVNGPSGTSAHAWSVLAFRGVGFTTQLYFDKNTLAVKEWGGNNALLTTNTGNGWYKMITTNGNTNITNGSVIFGNVTSDASSEVGQDNANLFWDNSSKELGIKTNTPAASLDVAGTVKVGTAGTVLNSIIRFTNVSMTVTGVTSTNPITVVLNAAAYSAVLQNATIIVNPRTSLPTGVAIAFARANANGQITVKFVNTTTTQTFTYNYDITVIQ